MSQLIVHPSGSLRGAVGVPGDKSISHRALLLGALAAGSTHVMGWLPAADCQATLRCMRDLGVTVTQESDSELMVYGVGMQGLREAGHALDCGGSGTTMRLLAGIRAGQPFRSTLVGNEVLSRRPMGRIAEPLRLMGATIDGREGGRLPPLTIEGGRLQGIDYHLPVASAQVKSAILLAGLFANGETVVHEPGPSRDHTERMLRLYGIDVQSEGPAVRLAGGQALRGLEPANTGNTLHVPGDFSSAAFLLIAGCLVPASEVWLRGIGINPTRSGLLDALVEMNAEVGMPEALEGELSETGEPAADLYARTSTLSAAEIAGELVVRMIDEFPIFAVAATQAEGTTLVRDATELRVKESDRITAVATELRKLGAQIDELPDGMAIHGPTPLAGAVVDSHRDHRLAMALAVAGLIASDETVVQQSEVIDDSFPGFAATLRELGAEIEVSLRP